MRSDMPPRSSLTSSFAVSDAGNEVVCPLKNQDGTSCRKRCIGVRAGPIRSDLAMATRKPLAMADDDDVDDDEHEKRYRSMQEHIRRAHPAYYISKLPATEESFSLMVNTPPSNQARESTGQGIAPIAPGHDRNSLYGDEQPSSSPATPRNIDEYHGAAAAIPPPPPLPPTSHVTSTAASLPPTVSAAAALAQLHQNRLESSNWESEPETVSETEAHYHKTGRIELPGIAQMKQAGFLMSPFDPGRPRQLLPSILAKSVPSAGGGGGGGGNGNGNGNGNGGGRSSTLPPIQRREKMSRQRKSSIAQNARKAQHERKRSRGDPMRRMSYEGRKAMSAEPTGFIPTSAGKRWEDLIDAATSATEDVDGDRTPIPPSSPPKHHRASLPPFSTAFPQSYQASPLQNALTPPSYGGGPEPLPSVESAETYPTTAAESMSMSRSIEDSSPSSASQNVQIYCAVCSNPTLLRSAFACTECICGICRDCVDVLMAEQGARRRCSRCGTVGGKFRPFQLEIR